MKKTTIKIMYKRYYWQWIILAVVLAGLLFPLWIENTPDKLCGNIICGIVDSALIITCLIISVMSNQTAELSSEGILIKCKLYVVKNIPWTEIKRMKTNSLISGHVGLWLVGGKWIYMDWIEIYTSMDQVYDGRAYGGTNSRKKGPWCIAATKKNLDTLNEYIKEYTTLPEVD